MNNALATLALGSLTLLLLALAATFITIFGWLVVSFWIMVFGLCPGFPGEPGVCT